jgi:ectoine hydroxylase-related dioxygenase (phytanoyl-CoA dioxygenase family)
MLFELCELLEETKMVELITSHLGERPALSANKCTLRRVPVDTNTNWHQDGAFLGAEVRTLNVWLALSDCNGDAPGLEIVPRRLDTVLPSGTEGAMFDWSVSPEIVDEVSRSAPVVTPAFRAGDALLFDHLLLHRTAVEPGMTRERYAMEIWNFAPSDYPEGQIPVVL